VRLVALDGGELVGTIALREQAIESHPEYQPWLGGLYVAEPRRRRGVGTALVGAGMAVARGLGYTTVFATTEVAAGLLERLGWERVGSLLHEGQSLALYRTDLDHGLQSPLRPIMADSAIRRGEAGRERSGG